MSWIVLVFAAWAVKDGDGDGLPDRADACPFEAEDADRYRDDDGCIDPPVVVRVDVVDNLGRPIADAAVVARSGARGASARGGILFSMDPGPLEVQVEASGFGVRKERVVVGDDPESHVRLVLAPLVRKGLLTLVVRDTTGAAVAGASVSVDGAPPMSIHAPVTMDMAAGSHFIIVRAPGSGGARSVVDVPVEGEASHISILQPPRVIIHRERIELTESIFFETGLADLRRESDPLLDEVALVVADHPEILRLSVQGHTDSRGDEAANQVLSEGRAAAVVNALVARGISKARLESVGFGESLALVPGDDETAWSKNRRVDLIILPP